MRIRWNEAAASKVWKLLIKNKYVLAVLLVGLILIMLPSGEKSETPSAAISNDAVLDFSLDKLEAHLCDILSKIDGAGNVSVMLTLKSSTEKVIARDGKSSYKSDGEGEVTGYEMENEEITVIVSSGSGTDSAVVLKYIYPQFLGAVVVAEGAGSAEIRLRIIEAVAAVTGLGTDKISVIKMKS